MTAMNISMKNKVQLIGNLGNDPELKNLANGQALLRLRLATNERYKGADGEWKEATQWHPIVAWGKQAERLAGLVRKGTGLVVEGRLVQRTYDSKDGERRYSTEVVISDFQLLGRKPEQD
jgi:single-strand DNA-binding protein